jgi:hypothetical protein
MAAHKTKKHRKHSSSAGHHNAPRKKNRGHRTNRGHKHHRNPGGGMVADLAVEAVSAVGGLVGSKMLTQAVLGANNTGMFGYFGNAAATAILAVAAHYIAPRNRKIRDGVVLGGAMGIVARAINDYTPFGAYLASAGVGEYGMAAYMPANGVVASRYVDPWNSSQTEIPQGWGGGGQMAINSSGAPAGVAGWGDQIYGGGSLY